MTQLKWKDVSSFSRSDKDRTPNSFEARAGSIRLCVHRHIDYPGQWCWSSPDLNIRATPLDEATNPMTAEDAKIVAEREFRYILETALAALTK